MKQEQYLQILRDSQEIQLRDKFSLLSSKAHEYVLEQIKQLESQYKQQILSIFEQYSECMLMCKQLQFKNEQYSKLLLEQEFKSIQTKNYVSLEIVNQLLTQKINSLLLQLKNNNIISESDYFSQKNQLQMNIAEIYINCNNKEQIVKDQENDENAKQLYIMLTSKQESQTLIKNFNNYDTIKNHSVETQTKSIKKKEKLRNQSKIQNNMKQSPSTSIDRELLECKKSIQELQKTKNDLQANNQFLKSQNQNLLNKLNKQLNKQIKCHHNVTQYMNNPHSSVIKKFLKFDDIIFKNVKPFSMAQSFDLRQGNISSRQFFSRPKTSVPNSTRGRFNTIQQRSRNDFYVL
ncbi:unnamed protein product [Paramecium sonneborni]|uniref:Uncharacterized protein n=1 Tax=Paramecium sonneborni TaxID=65129 RepID=A0A8S1LFX2_9CILI|nr:unnamed protein product [Paramecium sonneborni]